MARLPPGVRYWMAFSGYDPMGAKFGGGLGNGGHRQASAQVHGGSDPRANQGPGTVTFIPPGPGAAIAAALNQAYYTQQFASIKAAYEGFVAEPEIEDTGVKVGEVLGWRAWRVEEGWLYSMYNASYEWDPDKNAEAYCVGPNVGEGIHAFHTRKQAIDTYGGHGNSCNQIVVGRVALWGQIYEFEKGWHGEFARVHSLDWISHDVKRKRKGFFMSRNDPSLLNTLRKTYGLSEADTTTS